MKSLWPVVASALMVVSGCSATNEIDYSSVNLVAVGGTVTLDGAALPSAVITFEDPATGNFSFARTDSSGNYTLQFDSEANGVLPGTKIVKVSTTRTVLGLAGEEEGEEAGESSEEGGGSAATDKKKEAVPACYNKDSKLSVEVTKSTTTFNFDLKSDCTTTTATP